MSDHHALSSLLAWCARQDAQFVAELSRFLRFPSVSGEPGARAALVACAEWLARHLRGIGLERAEVVTCGGPPVVYAEWRGAHGAPTVLVYGHYDVQPPGPARDWATPPFDPTRIGDDLHARGSSDDKGQLFVHLKALEACLKTRGRLPVNVLCVLEGGEEIGSPGLAELLGARRRRWNADLALVSDTQMPRPGQPAITLSLRGQVAFEVTVSGADRELHSGVYGGAVPNPALGLAQLLASLHDSTGRIAVPGLYAGIAPARRGLSTGTPTDQDILTSAGARRGRGEPGWSLYQRMTTRPAIEATSIRAGTSSGVWKASVPSAASARLDARLAPGQDPAAVERQLRRHVAAVLAPGCRASFRTLLRADPVELESDHPVLDAAVSACAKAFGRSPVFLRSGGSIPAVGLFRRVLGIPSVLIGLGLPDDHIHAANERFHLPNFRAGIAASLRLLHHLAAGRT